MAAVRTYGPDRVAPKAKRRKAIDQPTHSALATLLARSIAYANANRPSAANDAAHHLVRVLKAHGINPNG
jgi:hypothetical protein